MHCTIWPLGTLAPYRFVVCIIAYRGQWLLVRNRNRATWETAGGHIEMNETPLEAACRELYEETGALRYRIAPVFDYRAGVEGSETNGQVFTVHMEELGDLPPSEIAEVALFDTLPPNLTYPAITPHLFARHMAIHGLHKGMFSHPYATRRSP